MIQCSEECKNGVLSCMKNEWIDRIHLKNDTNCFACTRGINEKFLVFNVYSSDQRHL